MKIYYLNDTDSCKMLHKDDCFSENMKYADSQSEELFELNLKEGEGIFVKQWNDRILIGRIDKNALDSVERRRKHFEASSETCEKCGCKSKASCS